MLFPFVKWFSRRKIIVNLDGLTEKRLRWPMGRWFIRVSRTLALKYADEVVCDNQKLLELISPGEFCKVRVIEYGGDHVTKPLLKQSHLKTYPFLGTRYAIKVCRIHPENQVEMILETFARYPRFALVIIGDWDRTTYGRALRKRFNAYAHIHMLDPIYEVESLNILRSNAYLYVHGHSMGGTNPSLVEAMALGLPVLSFDVAFNRETTQEEAKYFRNQAQLMELLEWASAEKLQRVGDKMAAIAASRYTWIHIMEQYAAVLRTGMEEYPYSLPQPVSAHLLPASVQQEVPPAAVKRIS